MCYVCGTNLSEKTLEKASVAMPPMDDELDWQLTDEDIKNFERKLDDATKKLRARPHDQNLWFRRASILMELNRYEDAVKAYNQGLKLDPNNIKAWSAKAFAVNRLGDQKEAAKCYRKAMEIGTARSLDLDNIVDAVDHSTSYKEALDRAISVLMVAGPSQASSSNQPRCPSCSSFKVLPHGQGRLFRCHKCGHIFNV
jgi:tetratricopeptide (TPR) repeat protein